MMIVSRSQAKEKGFIYYYTGKPCKFGHICKRYTRNGQCFDCQANKRKSWYRRNKEHVLLSRRNWTELNRDKRNIYHARRRLVKLNGTLIQSCPEIAKKYKESVRLTEETGVTHQVDHIIPLVGKTLVDGKWTHTVSGLHVSWNLQVIPKVDNIAKSCYLSK